MNSQTKSSHPSNKSTATSRIVIYDVERTETASQALPALKAITTISAHQQECTGVYMPSVGIVVRRMIRAWMAIWTFGGLPAFNLTVCGLPTRMDVDTLRLPRILCNSGFLATNMYTMDDKKTKTVEELSAYNKFVSAFSKKHSGTNIITDAARAAKAKKSRGRSKKSNCYLLLNPTLQMTDIETSMFAGANFKSFRQHLTCHKQELWMHKGELYNSKQHDTF
jgi:hypothetical protein